MFMALDFNGSKKGTVNVFFVCVWHVLKKSFKSLAHDFLFAISELV